MIGHQARSSSYPDELPIFWGGGWSIPILPKCRASHPGGAAWRRHSNATMHMHISGSVCAIAERKRRSCANFGCTTCMRNFSLHVCNEIFVVKIVVNVLHVLARTQKNDKISSCVFK
jgi:hypothetical protein